MYRESYELMEQIKLFESPSVEGLEKKVNDFIRNLERSIEIKDISYSHFVIHLPRWSAMVRYNDPNLE